MPPTSNGATAAPSAPVKKAVRETLKGPIEAANRTGIKIAGAWYDYAKLFKGSPVAQDAVGLMVMLTVIVTLSGKKVIEGYEFPKPEPAEVVVTPPVETPKAPEEGSPKVSPDALDYAADLAQREGLTPDELSQLVTIRFKKDIEEISPDQARTLIEFLGGYKRKA